MAATSSPHGRTSIQAAFIAALGAGLAVRVALLVGVALHQSYLTDVSYYDAQAVRYLLSGVDPYGAAYSVPASLATPGAADVFAYLPGVFSFIVPAGALGPSALGMVAADLVVALSLWRLGPRGALPSLAYFLFPPVVLFSTYFVNDSLPAIAFVAVAIMAQSRGRSKAGALLWGLAFGTSVEAWFVFPFYAAYSLRRGRAVPLALSILTAAAVVLPFFAWGPSAFLKDTVMFQFQRSSLPLFYPGPFGLNLNPSLQGVLASVGLSAPLAVRAVLALAVLALLLWRYDGSLRGLALGAASFAAASLFLVPGVSFWSYFELPLMLLAAWYALRPADVKAGAPPPILKEPR